MQLLRNVLAVVGVVALVLVAYCGITYGGLIAKVRGFDPQALPVYGELAQGLLESGNSAAATVWRVKVEDGLTIEDVEETMRSVAIELNIKNVGELALSERVSLMRGEPYRYVKVFMFCNALTAAEMLDFNDAYAAYLPCRITLVEDQEGQLWLYTLNMDPMIYGGTPLPEALKKETLRVKSVILAIMNRGASGEF
jgi:hypothetical protein